jgi:type III secretion system FlhB-like substrate exporter
MTLSGEYRAKLSNASVDEMIKIWPHHFRPGKTNAADDPVKIAKKHNVAITAIEIAMSYLTTCNWKINLPRPLHEQVRDKNVHQIFTIPSDIREQLASLLIKLATRRQWVQSE